MHSTNIDWAITRRHTRLSRWCVFFCSLVLLPLVGFAQANEGVVSGVVRNTATDAFLEGAEVTVAGTRLSTLTSRDGSFQLSHVPSGTQKITVFYTGLDAQTVEVEVNPSKAANVQVALTSDTYVLAAVQVTGRREGNAAALTEQRNAINVVNVVSTDAYGSVADGNIGNMLQNIPGLTTVKEAGDVVGIGVRGTPAELNALTIDGARMSSAIAGFSPNGDRAGLVDQIPSEFIKSIEVTKALTPNMMMDSLGGAINLITKSAFDFDKRVISFRAGPLLNTFREGDIGKLNRWGGQLAATYMDTFGKDRQWGLTVSASFTDTTNNRDRIQQSHPFVTDNRDVRNRMLSDTNIRIREGIGAKLEFRPNDTLHLYVDVMINRFNMDTDRWDFQANSTSNNVADYSMVSRAAIEAGATPLTTAGATAGIAPNYTDTYTEMLNAQWYQRAAYEIKREKYEKIGFGGEKEWGDSKLSFSASYNPSSYYDNYEFFFAQWKNIGFSSDASVDDWLPKYKQTYGTSIYGTDLYKTAPTSAYLEQEPYRTSEDLNSINIDYERKFSVFGLPMTVSAGGAYRYQNRWTINSYNPDWQYNGPSGVFGQDPLTPFLDGNTKSYGLFNGQYPRFYRFDFGKVLNSFKSNPTYWSPIGTSVSFYPPPSIAVENVYALYLQDTIKINKLTVIGGVRMERTYTDGYGRLSDPQTPSTVTVHRAGNYRQWFPSIHFRYEPIRNLVAHASISTSAARAALSDIMPTTSVSYNSTTGFGTVSVNNPGLLPQYSTNYDASVEYYFNPAGVLSAGFYRKDVKNFIYSDNKIIGSGPDNGWGGRYEGFNETTTKNFGLAKIQGFELNYMQQLKMLPKPFNGLSPFVNYTEQKTEGQYRGGVTQLALFIPRTTNIGLDYTYGKFEARYTYHLKHSWLVSFNSGTPSLSTYSTNDRSSDINIQYKWRPNIGYFIDYTNIFNQYPAQYTISTKRIDISELYGARLNFGITGRF